MTAAKLGFDPATQTELAAHTASDDHDARYATRGELGTAGVINTAGNPVHWSRLIGVPAGFADGTDANTTTADNVVCSGCVHGGDIAPSTITSSDIGGGAIESNHIRNGTITAADIDQNAVGANALNIGYQIKSSSFGVNSAYAGTTLLCPAGHEVLTGGWNASVDADIHAIDSYPPHDSGWSFRFANHGGPVSVTVYVVCADVQ